jgi:hypothetical protein
MFSGEIGSCSREHRTYLPGRLEAGRGENSARIDQNSWLLHAFGRRTHPSFPAKPLVAKK